MRRRFEVGVAIHAREHAAVDRILESFGIHIQADAFAVDFLV